MSTLPARPNLDHLRSQAKKHLDELRRTGKAPEWVRVSLVTGGTPMDEEWLAYGRRTQTGNETKVVFGGQTQVHALMRIL